MLKHEDLMEQTFLNVGGYVICVDNRHPKFPHAIAAVQSLNPEYVNLVAGSLLLYRTAQEAVTYMEALIIYLEKEGKGEAVPSLAAVQATLDSAMKIAREGLPKKD